MPVRGLTAYSFSSDAADEGRDPVSLQWVDNGREISVQGRGLSNQQAISMLDALRWRTDGSDGFEVASSTLPLIAEDSTANHPSTNAVIFTVTGPDGPTDANGAQPPTLSSVGNQYDTVFVGTTVFGDLTPQLLYDGTRQPDGSVRAADGAILIEPGGTIIRISSAGHLDQLLRSLRPASLNQIRDLADKASDRLINLPEVASADFTAARVVLRGGTTKTSITICLQIDQRERCRSAPGLLEVPHWENGVTIDGRWFIVGRQPAADPTPVLYPWDPNNSAMSPSATIIAPTQAHVVGSDLLWYAEVPQGIDTVGIGHLDNGTLVSITTGSPNSSGIARPNWYRQLEPARGFPTTLHPRRRGTTPAEMRRSELVTYSPSVSFCAARSVALSRAAYGLSYGYGST